MYNDLKREGDNGFFHVWRRSLIHLFANEEVCSGDETIIVERYIDTIDIH